jgi:hypothetical protein
MAIGKVVIMGKALRILAGREQFGRDETDSIKDLANRRFWQFG